MGENLIECAIFQDTLHYVCLKKLKIFLFPIKKLTLTLTFYSVVIFQKLVKF